MNKRAIVRRISLPINLSVRTMVKQGWVLSIIGSVALITIVMVTMVTRDVAIPRQRQGHSNVTQTNNDKAAQKPVKLDGTDYISFPKRKIDRVFYNRVPKCGSTTVTAIFRTLSELQEKFNHKVSANWRKIHLHGNQEKREFVRMFGGLERPLLYDRHFHFFNFERYGMEQPVYINIIRDPIESYVSRWYFNIRPGGWKRKLIKYDTLDECLRNNCSEFGESRDALINHIRYFCGHEDVCGKDENASLALAKQNVARYFSVVGITEEFPAFFELLEHYHPDYFLGATKAYLNLASSRGVLNKGQNKRPLEEETRARLKYLLRYEYDFYYFVTQRFHKMYSFLQLV